MIIVKTKNGDRFINDKAVTMVAHDREKAVVNAHGENGAYYHIEDVEGIIYNNDAQPMHWKDEGSERYSRATTSRPWATCCALVAVTSGSTAQ